MYVKHPCWSTKENEKISSREVVLVLLNASDMSALEYCEISSLPRIKMCSSVVVYDSAQDDDEERGRFWNDLVDKVLDRDINCYWLCVMRDLKGLVRDTVREDIICLLGVTDQNENGRRVEEFCVEKRFFIGNT